jgi:hypothetical protein
MKETYDEAEQARQIHEEEAEQALKIHIENLKK